ncbi:androgen-induced gene 1 protein [Aplysia californica]|uniref:Androgen-induced gene 1 protein n=1 Tax=Aplysia californica TaxID=6500 RepID=A0ABM0JTX6_APLCA|nr:androgen-induced gene 1 protein [Aplysia californica]
MSALIILFHLIVFTIDAVSLVYDIGYIDIGHAGFGGKFKFLTIWNICLQTLYYGLSLLKDLTEEEAGPAGQARRSTLHRWRDSFLTIIAFPVGSFVVMTFWALYAIDRELVYPKRLDGIIPPWLNHTLHTTVLPFLLIEKSLIYHQHPKKHVGILGSCGLALIYLAWILFIAYYDNFWVYPVLEVLAAHERAVFIFVCLLFFASLYILGESITTFNWRKELRVLRVVQISRNKKD